jgi:hypothetical protein
MSKRKSEDRARVAIQSLSETPQSFEWNQLIAANIAQSR